MSAEAPIRAESREELVYLLSQASELEHGLMCEYLFAMFSLKRQAKEGPTTDQLEAAGRWDRMISGVAAQEMLHLALVSNLLTAVGAVKRVYTNLAVLDVTPRGFMVLDMIPGLTLEALQARTEARLYMEELR